MFRGLGFRGLGFRGLGFRGLEFCAQLLGFRVGGGVSPFPVVQMQPKRRQGFLFSI